MREETINREITMNDIESPYRPESDDGNFRVVDESGRVALNCGSFASAEQYAALLTQAFQRGFKAGFRAAKRKTSS
ncbi:MAG TPA: hypothetical protein VH280_00575 [Verrucomicrobiae bacterium]|jgi:hypothetical protein|nr:hypothetical protein [Verrucomicrobiae bacterium]